MRLAAFFMFGFARRGFVVRLSSCLRVFAALHGSAFLSAVCMVRPILPLKPVAKAWSPGLLFGRHLHCEGIVVGHILVVGVTSDLGLRS